MSGHRDQHEGPRGRTEPTLGDLDHLDAPAAPGRARDELPQVTIDPDRRRGSHGTPSRRSGPRRWPWLLLLVVAGLLLALWLNQDRLRGLVPSTGLNDTLSRAELALQDGRLDGPDGARELFESARAQEPDNDRARDGLRKVGMAELSRADEAFNAGKLDEAAKTLDTARELLGGGSDVDRLDAAISKARGTAMQVDGLIEQAQQALAAGRLDGKDGAGALYSRVLAGDPGNAVAAHGLDKVGAALAAKARAALAANDTTTAAASIDQLAALLPNYGELPSLRAAQAQGQKQASDELATALKQGQDALRAGHIGHIGGDGDDTALAHFKHALALDPDNAAARAGLGQVAQALIVQANAALDGDDRAAAVRLLDAAAALAPRSADLAAARARLGSDSGSRADSDTSDGAAPAPEADATVPAILTPAQNAEVTSLVARAQAAARRGEIMLPPGESAYDLYRSALAIDGNNAPARQGLQDLPNIVSRQLNQALANGNLAQAGELLTDLSDLAPGDAGQDQLRQRLAGAWLDQAEQQLARGDRANATQSLDQARKIAPNQPRLQDIAARLQSAH